MSTRVEGGGGGEDKEAFLSTHRCPGVDLLPHHKSEMRILPPADSKQPEVGAGQSECNYLDVSSTPHCDEDEAISDWSEEDLSLHFSPSVIISSDDEESEGTFECVDITMETLGKGQEVVPKMVPKRQIQLKKKEEEKIVKEKKFQVKDEPAEGTDSSREVPAQETLSPRTQQETLSPRTHQRPDVLLRQHSMPASTPSREADSYRVYRGLIAGANQGLQVGGNTKQRLQKSFSLDETKTKMASCIIKSVLSKKMQAEQSHCKSPPVQNKPTVVPNLPQAVEQQRAREGGGGETAGGAPKAPIHVVRDMRSLVKNTYGHTFPTSQNSQPLSFKVVGQGGSPPPSYLQAVGVKVHNQSKTSVKQVRASLPQPQQRSQRSRPDRPITQQRRGSLPITNRGKEDAVTGPAASGVPTKSPDVNEPPAGAASPKAGASLPPTALLQPPGCAPPSSRHPEATPPLVPGQEQSAVLGVPSQFVPGSPQQLFHPCFLAPAALPPFAPAVVRHMGKVSYVQAPLNYLQTPLQPNLHLLRTPEENQSALAGNEPKQRVRSPPAAAEKPEQHLQPHGPGPQGCGDALGDAPNPAASTPAAPSQVPAPGHLLEPQSLPCFYVDVGAQSQRKMLLDPETGQYVQVFLPAASASCSGGVFPVAVATSAPFALPAVKPAPALLSVVQFQPAFAVSPLYAPPFLPFPLSAPSVNFTHAPL